MKFNRVFITGDKHGRYDWLEDWCNSVNSTYDDALIILGDAGFMYYGPKSEKEKSLKSAVNKCPITILCVRGNHESRPTSEKYQCEYDADKHCYFEPNFPHILYFEDGAEVDINDHSCLMIGGAYSVDKEFRLARGFMWFPDEELSEDEMVSILENVEGKRYDYVFTHTCPAEWQPTHLFMHGIDQSKISKRMEQFLSLVRDNIEFGHWYFGHYHDDILDWGSCVNTGEGEVSMLFNNFEEVM